MITADFDHSVKTKKLKLIINPVTVLLYSPRDNVALEGDAAGCLYFSALGGFWSCTVRLSGGNSLVASLNLSRTCVSRELAGGSPESLFKLLDDN